MNRITFSCITAISLVLLSIKALAQPSSDIDKLSKQWLQLERSTLALSQDWQLEKQLLNQRIALLREQNKQLTQVIKNADQQTDNLSERRQELIAAQAEIEQSLSGYRQIKPQLHHFLQMQMARTPPYLQQQLANALAQLDSNKPLNKEYQVLVEGIKQIAKANQLISVKQGSIELEGEKIMTEQLYLGNGQAWFITQDNSRAGIGFASLEGWHWQQSHDDDNQSIRQAINDAKNLTPGQLIALPVKLPAMAAKAAQ